MEVFCAFSMDEEVPLLEQTLNAWAELDWADCAVIQVPPGGKFEIQRRVIADNLAKGRFYILADLGCIPGSFVNPNFMEPVDGIIGFKPSKGNIPTGARIIQKGAVTKWPPKSTDTYDKEHAAAASLAGFRVSICPNTYRRLQES